MVNTDKALYMIETAHKHKFKNALQNPLPLPKKKKKIHVLKS